jgi:hypothetical protein
VLAHVPDLNDFVSGMKALLADDGIITMEFPHLQRLMAENQFDTIYHEHFSYFSFVSVEKVFAHHGITLFDVEELPTHGGSLRIYGRHRENDALAVGPRVTALRQREIDDGFLTMERYRGFDAQVKHTKRKLLTFLIEAREQGKTVAGYGAPGKGNTLLNYCGIRTDLLDFTTDANLRADPAVEPEGRDHAPGGVHRRMGRALRGADSGSAGPLIAAPCGPRSRAQQHSQHRTP